MSHVINFDTLMHKSHADNKKENETDDLTAGRDLFNNSMDIDQ